MTGNGVTTMPPLPSRRSLWLEVLVVFCIGIAPDFFQSQLALLSPPTETFREIVCYVVLRAVWVSIPVLWILGRSQEPLARFGLVRPTLADVLLGAAAFGVALVTEHLAWVVVQQLPADAFGEVLRTLAVPRSTFDYALLPVLAIANGFAEGLVVRAYLIVRLRQLAGIGTALAVSTACFASYHTYQGLHGMLLLAAVGLVFGGFFLATRRLWPIAIAHAALDVHAFAMT